MLGLRLFIEKLRHGSVWQLLGVYLVGSWIALQVVDILANNFDLPGWFPRFTLALLAIGLPVVVVTSLVQKRLARWAASDVAETPAEKSALPGGGRVFTWRNAIRGGVFAFALWAVVAVSWLLFGPGADLQPRLARAGDLRSIAVLPLAGVQTDEQSLAFTSGIHDDLLTQLSKIDSLTTISRTSVMKYRDTQLGVRQIAAELGVATLLEGSVQLAGDQVRVSVQLIDARNDSHLWAETYDAELTTANIFAIQSDIARQIAMALSAKLTPDVQVRLATRPTESLEAYDLYTRGRYLHHKPGAGTKSALEEAARLFRQAIEVDPGFAPAHAGLDETLADAHTSLADVYESELRFEDAERHHLRALFLNPGSAEAHRRYARLLLDLQRFDQLVAELRRAVELNPLSISYRLSLTSGLWFTGDYAGGIAEAREVLKMEPDNPGALYSLGFASVLNGEHEAGIAALERALEVRPEYPFNAPGLAWAYARAGRRADALRMLEQVEAQGQMLKEIAIVYGELGELERAFEYLERAYLEDPGSLTYINSDPTAEALKSDHRFADLVARLGL